MKTTMAFSFSLLLGAALAFAIALLASVAGTQSSPILCKTVCLRNNSDQHFTLALTCAENPGGVDVEFSPWQLVAYSIHDRDFTVKLSGLGKSRPVVCEHVDLLGMLSRQSGVNVVDIFSPDLPFKPLVEPTGKKGKRS
jgi:hypothetical protein